MTDLGFGIVDRRSVLVVLLIIFVSVTIFRNPIPIDTTTAAGLFMSLVAFTGFIYLARTVGRVILAAIYTIIIAPSVLQKEKRHLDERLWFDQPPPKGLQKLGILLKGTLSNSFERGILEPLLRNQEWEVASEYYEKIGVHSNMYTVLGMLDRVLLVSIVFISTLPQLSVIRQLLGTIGVVLMLAVYVVTGGFTFVLKDAIKKAEEDLAALIPYPPSHSTGGGSSRSPLDDTD